MAVRRLIIVWTLALASVAQETLSYETPAPWKTQEDANLRQRSRIQKANIGDLHDDSNPPARIVVRISGDQDEINAGTRHIVEFRHNMNTSRLEAQELQPNHIEDFWDSKPHVPPESIESNLPHKHPFPLSETEQDVLDDYRHRLSLQDSLYDEILSANDQGPGGTNTGISVPSPHSSLSDGALAQYAFLPEETPANNEDLMALIPLPVVEDHNSKSVNYVFKYPKFTQRANSMLEYGQHWPAYAIDHNERQDRYQELDSAGTSVNGENNELGSDFEDINARDDKDKRRFDSISGFSSFGGFGKREDKRKFDSISGISSFGGFGKREDKRKFDSISGISSFGGFGKREDKRKFDSISGISSFGGFGKREDKRKFDSISGISSFGGFGKREDKRRFDSISGISSFGGFGKREDKRKFDSISGISSFGGFGKREDKKKFDSISGISSFGGFGKREDKRKFDSISGISSFGGFGKREDKRKFDSISGISSFGGFGKREDKRRFDSISGISSFGGFGKREDKRKFDSISGISSFGGFGKREDKRKFDSISGISSFGGFGKRKDKRKFDSISGISSFGGFGKREDKRKFDSISGISSFGGFGKRSAQIKLFPESEVVSFGKLGKISTSDNMKLGPFEGNMEVKEKRKFDSISGHSSFGNVGKRQMSDKENVLSTSALSSLDAIYTSLDEDKSLQEDKRLEEDKRRFDSISGISSFGKRRERENENVDAKDEFGSFESFNNRKLYPASGLSLFGESDTRDAQQGRRFETESVDGSFGKNESKEKIKFDPISRVSSLGRLRKPQTDDRIVASISGYSPYGIFAAENKQLYFNPDVLSFKNVGTDTAKTNYQMANLDDKSTPMYEKEKDKVDNIYKELRIRQHNDSQRSDKYNALHALIQELRNREQADEEHNFNSNSKDSEAVDDWRINNYNNMNIADNVPAPESETLSQVYNNNPLVFNKRKLDRIETNHIFGALGKRTVVRDHFNSESKQHRQNTEDVSKRRFDRISTKSNVFRSFGKRSPRSIDTQPKFNELGKRRFDRISDISRFGRLGKRAHDVSEYLSPGGLGSTIYNTTGTAVVNSTGNSQYNDKPNSDPLSGFHMRGNINGGSTAKRRLYSVDHSSTFRMFTKKGSGSENFVVPAGLDPDVVGLRESHPFPAPPKRAQEQIILDSLPRTALRVDTDHFDSVGHPSILRMSGDYSSNRWS